jgi:hypothetical protein
LWWLGAMRNFAVFSSSQLISRLGCVGLILFYERRNAPRRRSSVLSRGKLEPNSVDFGETTGSVHKASGM